MLFPFSFCCRSTSTVIVFSFIFFLFGIFSASPAVLFCITYHMRQIAFVRLFIFYLFHFGVNVWAPLCVCVCCRVAFCFTLFFFMFVHSFSEVCHMFCTDPKQQRHRFAANVIYNVDANAKICMRKRGKKANGNSTKDANPMLTGALFGDSECHHSCGESVHTQYTHTHTRDTQRRKWKKTE